MKTSKFVLLFLISVLFSACTSNTKEIDSECSSGVVLIKNAGYYELEIEGESFYFSNYDAKEGVDGFVFDEDSVRPIVSYGTGFFVSEFGEIVTNRHVITSTVTEKEAQKMLSNLLKALKSELSDEYDEITEAKQEISSLRIDEIWEDDPDYDLINTCEELLYAAEERQNELSDLYHVLDEIDYRDAELHYHNEVSIAYNDTYVTKYSDFIECVVKKVSEDSDLALVQLKDKRTPADKYIFEVPDKDMLENYTMGEKIAKLFGDNKNDRLYMISFNLGPALGITENGVMSQINEGGISQNTKDRVMYSIPALHGSSGSPVVNGRKQLVAINFAGLDQTQGFNYGLKTQSLREMLY